MLEAVEHIGTEALVVVLVLLIRDILDENGGIEVDERARHTLTTVFREVDGYERTIGTVALADHRHTAPATGVGIEVIGLLACGLVLHLHEVGGKHRIPLAVDIPGEDRTFVAPLRQVFDRGRPHTDITTAIGGIVRVVRANDISAELARLIRVLKHTGLAIRHMLPKREIGVLGADTQCRTHQERE